MPSETGSKIENITIRTTGAVSDELAVRFEAVVLAPHIRWLSWLRNGPTSAP